MESRWTCQVIGYKKTTHTDQCMHSGTSILWSVAHVSQYFAKGTNPSSSSSLAAKCHKVVNASRVLSGTYGQSCPNLVPEAMCTAAVKPLLIDYLQFNCTDCSTMAVINFCDLCYCHLLNIILVRAALFHFLVHHVQVTAATVLLFTTMVINDEFPVL